MSKENIFIDLRDDEERSEEGSEMGDSTADFLVDDTPPTETGIPSQLSDILTNEDTDSKSVPKRPPTSDDASDRNIIACIDFYCNPGMISFFSDPQRPPDPQSDPQKDPRH